MTSLEEVEHAVSRVPGVAEAVVRLVEGRGKLRLRIAADADSRVVSERVAELLRGQFGLDVDPDQLVPTSGEDEPGSAFRHQLPPLVGRATAGPGVDDADDVVDLAPDAGEPSLPPTANGAAAREGRGALRGVEAFFSRVAEDEPSVGDPPRATRPVLADIVVHRRGVEIRADVRLRLGADDAHGTAVGTSTDQGVMAAVASATLAAVQELAPGLLRGQVDRVDVTTGGDARWVSVAVTVASSLGRDRLLGQALVDGDSAQAAARATLDAMNRRLARLLVAS